jgi:cytochrome b
MKLKLSGKVILVALLALGLATALGGCFSYHNDDRDRGQYEGDRHEEHQGGDRHEEVHVEVER